MGKARLLKRLAGSLSWILLLILSTQAVSAERLIVTTIGAPSCVNWTSDRKKEVGGGLLDGYGASLSRAWVLGYFSAINEHVEQERNLLDVIDVDAIALWLDRYCMRNPKKQVSEGVIDLAIELKKIAR